LQQLGTICGASPCNARIHVAEQPNRDAVGGADTNTRIICTSDLIPTATVGRGVIGDRGVRRGSYRSSRVPSTFTRGSQHSRDGIGDAVVSSLGGEIDRVPVGLCGSLQVVAPEVEPGIVSSDHPDVQVLRKFNGVAGILILEDVESIAGQRQTQINADGDLGTVVKKLRVKLQ
jgi:hypothetical protein